MTSLETSLLFWPCHLIFPFKSRAILAKKVLFGDQVKDVSYTAKVSLFRVEFKGPCKLYKCSIVVWCVVKYKPT